MVHRENIILDSGFRCGLHLARMQLLSWSLSVRYNARCARSRRHPTLHAIADQQLPRHESLFRELGYQPILHLYMLSFTVTTWSTTFLSKRPLSKIFLQEAILPPFQPLGPPTRLTFPRLRPARQSERAIKDDAVLSRFIAASSVLYHVSRAAQEDRHRPIIQAYRNGHHIPCGSMHANCQDCSFDRSCPF